MIRLMAYAIGLGVGCAAMVLCAPTPTHARDKTGQRATPGMTFVVLPLAQPRSVHFAAGTFRMGSSAEEVLNALTECSTETLSQRCPDFSDEQPVREVLLSPFWLDTREVSVGDYGRCVAARRCKPIPFHQGARRFDYPNLPATLVRHDDAERYCRFVGGSLPTEAQFERAARGETRRVYPWGNLYNSRLANHGKLALSPRETGDGFSELAPVEAFSVASTPEGVLQLAGNASEWVRDRYLPYYNDADRRNPQGPDANSGATERVVRGGGYLSPRGRIRGAARDSAAPEHRGADLGFRCAYDASWYAPERP
jgi:formylglycine-generating enzyme